MTPDQQIAEELLAWVELAEDQLRQDRGITTASNPVTLPDSRRQTETDRINAMACDRATRLWCMDQHAKREKSGNPLDELHKV